jgi:hypothetical protein
MKASLVAYNGRELHKKLEIKIIKFGYVRGCSKKLATNLGCSKFWGLIKVPFLATKFFY